MVTPEILLTYDQSRPDFIFPFARRNRSRGGQPPRRPRETPLTQAEPPRWNPKISRRAFVLGGGLLVAGTAAILLRPWELFAPQPDQLEPETLESLVIKAKKIEGDFRDNDLSNESVRNSFILILADVYAKDSPSNWTKQQIAQSIIWTKDINEFIGLVMSNSQRNRGEKGRDYFSDVPMLTTDNHKVIVNLANPAFNSSLLRRNGFSGDWNALKSLRRFLLHEFTHLTTAQKKDQEFFSLTDLPENAENVFLDGFTLQFSQAELDRETFHVINELVVETIAAERSNRLFGQTPPMPYIEQGIDLRAAQIRFRQILDAAGIRISDLERYNKTSDLYGFLTNLSSKVDFPVDISLAGRINYVLKVLDAVTYNNQGLIQEYTDRTKAKQRKTTFISFYLLGQSAAKNKPDAPLIDFEIESRLNK